MLLCALSLTGKQRMWTQSIKEISNCLLNCKRTSSKAESWQSPAHSGCQNPDNDNCLSYLRNDVGKHRFHIKFVVLKLYLIHSHSFLARCTNVNTDSIPHRLAAFNVPSFISSQPPEASPPDTPSLSNILFVI